MNVQDLLLSSLSRANIDYIAQWACESSENVEILYALIFSEDKKTAWRAAWALEKAHLLQPHVLADKLPEIISLLPELKADGLKRCLLLIVLRSPLPQPISVSLINTCFDWMMSVGESIAVQVCCMKILEKICGQEPDLYQELKLCLSGDLSEYSTGFRSSAKNILTRTNKR